MYEFGRGDRVRVSGGIYEGSGGTIVENNIQGDDEFSRYGVLLDGERHIRLFYNHCLEPENLLDCKIDESDDFDESETISNIYNEREPKLQIGDVVENTQDVTQSLSNSFYIIKEAITLVNNDLPVGYSYEVAPINSPDESDIFRGC